MVTHIQKGHPEEVKNKRTMRIKEAISFSTGTKEKPDMHIIGEVNGNKIFFLKPGKEFFREKKRNINDMTPCVGNLYEKYSFGDIWKDMLNLSVHINEETYKQLNVLIYRLAYLMDCTIIDKKVRYQPEGEVLETINKIQNEIDTVGYQFKVLEFLNFIDILSWNEDVKYQPDCLFEKEREKVGRINTILSLISIPLIFKQFVDEIIKNKQSLEKLNYSLLVDVAQNFSRTRGVHPISNKQLIQYLSPYLTE